MNDKHGVLERVTRVLVDLLGVSISEVNPESVVMEDLGADSLDAVEIIVEIEEEFDIYIEDKHIASIGDGFTVQNAVDMIREEIEKKKTRYVRR